MNYATKASILLSFLGLYCAKFFSVENQQIISFVGISLLGIIHGANDIKILFTLTDRKLLRPKLVLPTYIIAVLIGFGLFYFFPAFALIFFLLISGFHFGNQHWSILNSNFNVPLAMLFQTGYGLFVLFLLFTVHPLEVNQIIQNMIGGVLLSINFSLITLILGIVLTALALLIVTQFPDFKKAITINLFYLLLFTVIFFNAALLWGFAIYFILWHSLPSMVDQVTYLYGNPTPKNWFSYFKDGFIYWLVPSTGLFALYFFLNETLTFTAVFFSLIAAVTFPHVYVISKMQGAIMKKTTPSTLI